MTMAASAYTARFTNTAAEMAPRLQPNSSAMGLNMMPMVFRPPLFRNSTAKEAARTYHP